MPIAFAPMVDRLREIGKLMDLASRYRSWAEVAGNEFDRQRRIALAETVERKITELEDLKPA